MILWYCHGCKLLREEEPCPECSRRNFARPPLAWHRIMIAIYEQREEPT